MDGVLLCWLCFQHALAPGAVCLPHRYHRKPSSSLRMVLFLFVLALPPMRDGDWSAGHSCLHGGRTLSFFQRMS
uniref:Putative secreted protein n=1 Tax=Anopheles darlingi TaxID=43151 RepID=A0A2M4D8A9_ANODA